MKKLLQGEVLRKRASELGVSSLELADSKGNISEPELQRRVIQAERSLREHRLWIIALSSAIASIVSAIAAWVAVIIG